MRLRRQLSFAAAVLLVLACAAPAGAAPRKSIKKGLWAPTTHRGASTFPVMRDLGAGIWAVRLRWHEIAAARMPDRPRDPADPSYAWPAGLDAAVAEARRYGMRVEFEVRGAPAWANGGRPSNWVPARTRDFADFLTAAARRYRGVRYWVIWAEPTRTANFNPLPAEDTDRVKPLPRAARAAPTYYARLLDASYVALKKVRRRNIVVGGNTYTGGRISAKNWIRYLRLPGGRRPRMDMYGHHPFTPRFPDLRKKPYAPGTGDFSDLDDLARWVDRYLGRRRSDGRKLPLYLGEFLLPTDHKNWDFPYWLTREAQARFLRAALRIVRRWDRVHTFIYTDLYDAPPRPDGEEPTRGLLDWQGTRKPAFDVFARG